MKDVIFFKPTTSMRKALPSSGSLTFERGDIVCEASGALVKSDGSGTNQVVGIIIDMQEAVAGELVEYHSGLFKFYGEEGLEINSQVGIVSGSLVKENGDRGAVIRGISAHGGYIVELGNVTLDEDENEDEDEEGDNE